MYKVYIQINGNNCVIAINSNEFITDFANWIEIDRGMGDKYHHAQNNYLDYPLIDNYGAYRYKYENNTVVERSVEERSNDFNPPENTNEQDNELLKNNFARYEEKFAEQELLNEQLKQQIAEQNKIIIDQTIQISNKNETIENQKAALADLRIQLDTVKDTLNSYELAYYEGVQEA